MCSCALLQTEAKFDFPILYGIQCRQQQNPDRYFSGQKNKKKTSVHSTLLYYIHINFLNLYMKGCNTTIDR